MDFSGQLTLRQDSDEVVLLSQAIIHEHFAVDLVDVLLLGQLLQRADVDGVIFNAVDILETSLGQYSVNGHLTAFETDLTAVTGAGLSTLCPRVEVPPFPEPCPLPILRSLCVDPFAGFKLCKSISLMFYWLINYNSSTLTKCFTASTIPRIWGVASCSTV